MQSRVLTSDLSLHEKERRYSLLRQRLQGAGLSALIVYGGSQLGVPVHYLTRVWGIRLNAVIFPVEGEPVFLVPANTGFTGQTLAKQGCWISPENVFPVANLATELTKHINRLKLQKSRIGIDSFRWWPVMDFQIFTASCPEAQLVESHRLFGEIRGRKSSEELAEIDKAIWISDQAHLTFLANVKPGMTEIEAANKANEVLEANGVGDRIILIHSSPELVYPHVPGPSLIKKPNPITFSPEFTRKLGYGAQMIRAYWWEEPKGEYKRMLALCGELREMLIRDFRPGKEITQVGQSIENMIGEQGYECDKLGHGLGLSYGDSPYLTGGPDERDYMEWTVQADEVYAVHPMIRAKGGKPPFVMIGDMFFIGKDKTRWMTPTLPGLPEMIPQ
jgi:Xaa-Pro aminopeptidase